MKKTESTFKMYVCIFFLVSCIFYFFKPLWPVPPQNCGSDQQNNSPHFLPVVARISKMLANNFMLNTEIYYFTTSK